MEVGQLMQLDQGGWQVLIIIVKQQPVLTIGTQHVLVTKLQNLVAAREITRTAEAQTNNRPT
jgi:hypothetical protein